jgi:rhodanese-related sulfurtransferase
MRRNEYNDGRVRTLEQGRASAVVVLDRNRLSNMSVRNRMSQKGKLAEITCARGARRTRTGVRNHFIMVPLGVALAVFVAGAALIAGRSLPADAYEPADLASLEARVRGDFESVAQLSTVAFAARQSARTAPLVFDVREFAEYAVSHLPGAIRIDPGVAAEEFVATYGDKVAGRDVVFYCSVGVRSSKLAARVLQPLAARGANDIYNLEGGLFRWHNEGRSMVDASGPTDRIHPYDSYWGGLIARRNLIATTPKS